MATLYLKTAGGNFNGANWSITSAAGVDSVTPSAADNCIAELASGNLTINSGSVCRSFDTTTGTGSYGGTITHTAAVTFTIGDSTSGTGNVALKLNSGVTYTLGNATTSAISFISTSGTAQMLTFAGKTMGNVTFNGSGGSFTPQDTLTTTGDFTRTNGTFTANGQTVVMSGAGTRTLTGATTFFNLTRNGTAVKTDLWVIASAITITNILTIAGSSATNRLLVRSSTLGTSVTITNTGATMTWSNADFRDIALSDSFNASAITGLSGDCGGNTNITFTNSATQTFSGTTSDSWSTNAWSGHVPLPQDDVVINNAFSASQTITVDMPRLGRSIDFTGTTGNATIDYNSLAHTIYGSLTYNGSGSTANTSSSTLTFEGRNNFTFMRASKSFSGDFNINMVGGKLTIQDFFVLGGTGDFTLNNGEFDAATFNVSLGGLFVSNNSNTRVLTMGTGTWTLSREAAVTVWTINATATITVTPGTSTIAITGTGANIKTFAGGSKTYANISITGGGTGAVRFTGSNTFSNLPQIAGGTKTVQFTAATTTTFTGGTSFGNGTNIITISSITAATHTILKQGSQIDADYLNLTNSIISASGVNPAYAGTHSTDNGGNVRWTFTAPPTTAASSLGYGNNNQYNNARFGNSRFGREVFA